NFQNFKDISFDKEYAGVPGFTEEDLLTYFKIGIEEFAKKKEISFDEMFEKIKAMYNGYHFSYPSPDVYVPWCVINALSNQKLWDYWFDTGNPHPLYDMMKKFNVSITDLVQKNAKKESFNSSILSLETFLPLLYQTGYLTVKGYNSTTDEYLLDFPNKEVRIRLFGGLLYNYVKVSGIYHEHIAEEIAVLIKEGKIEKALLMLNEHLSAVGLPNQNDDYYLQVLFIIFGLGGLGVSIEGRTPDGQTGIAIHTTDSIYTLGIKIDKSALDAIKLIDEMGYAKTIAMKYPRHKIFKLGINFQRATSTIKDFIIKPL
ncbi:MAG: AAA family ATPase, partial [Prevotella sp.]|nr:AAA family ATPase [Prevotella sp.]